MWPKRRLREHEFLHAIVTRFNLGQPSFEWLAPRLRLFERFALPSIQGQTCQNFTWLLLCDPQTEEKGRRELERYTSETIQIVWMGPDRAEYFQRIRELSALAHTHLVTTRIDTDDALATHFIGRVQQTARAAKKRYFINLPAGYHWWNKKISSAHHRSNQFISCCEPLDEFQTVYCDNHTKLRKLGSIVQVDSRRPSWLYTCHESNIWNRPQRRKALIWKDEAAVLTHIPINTHVELVAPDAFASESSL